MFPNLSYLLEYLTGIHIEFLRIIQTFGFFVALAFIGGYWAFTQEFKRKEKQGVIHSFKKTITVGSPLGIVEIIGNGIFGFILGFKILDAVLHFSSLVDNPQEFLMSLHGNWVGGVIFGGIFIYWAYYENKKELLPKPEQRQITVHPYQLMGSILFWAAVCGFMGAKLFNGLENWNDFMKDPLDMLIGTSGFTFYGGLIGGGAVVLYIAGKHGIRPLTMLDIGGPGMMLSYGLGRIGCQMSGDGDWGINNTNPKPGFLSWVPDWMWSFKFPHNVNDEGIPMAKCYAKYCHELAVPVYPTSFYESVICILLFFFLWSIRDRIKWPGVMFGIYMILAGVERFFIELIRVNTRYVVAGVSFTQAEMISVLMVLGGAALIYNGMNKKATAAVNA